MPIYTLTNIPSMRAQRYLGVAQRSLDTALERLSSGKRINNAGDDPAGLLLSTRFGRSVTAWDTGANNLRMGLDMLKTADSFSTIVKEDLQRMYELASQAKNGLLSDSERELLDKEFKEIIDEVERLTEQTKYLGRGLLNGSTNISIQAGEGTSNVVTVAISTITTGNNGLAISNLGISTFGRACTAVSALSTISFERLANVVAEIGAKVNAFGKSIDATDALVENLTSAQSRIENADLAEETTNLTNAQIVVQSGISALVQANSAQTLALALLGG